MRWSILVLLLLIPAAYAVQIEGFVNDDAGVLSAAEKSELQSLAQGIYDSGKAQYAIVVISSLEGRDIEGYSYELAQGNLGDTEKNNGLLLLVAIDDRKYRFETGRGLEADLPDIILGRIGRNIMAPYFQQGEYGAGIIAATEELHAMLVDGKEPIQEEELPISIAAIIFIIIVILIIFFIARASRPRRRDSDYFTAAWLLGQMMKGGGSGGGFGGSGGGFGGGSFGGGGASGGW